MERNIIVQKKKNTLHTNDNKRTKFTPIKRNNTFNTTKVKRLEGLERRTLKIHSKKRRKHDHLLNLVGNEREKRERKRREKEKKREAIFRH